MANNNLVFVSNVFFLNDEKPFRALRSYLRKLDTVSVKELDMFDYNVETNEIEVAHWVPLKLDKSFEPALVREKLQSGYIQLTMTDLLKIFNV